VGAVDVFLLSCEALCSCGAAKCSRNIKWCAHKPCHSAKRIFNSSLCYQDSFTTQTRF